MITTPATKARRVLSWLPDYDVAEDGEVRRITPNRIHKVVPYVLHGTEHPSGYRRIKLVPPGEAGRVLLVSRLVCEAFHGPAPTPLHQAAHWDGDCSNNHFRNLRWATPQENGGDDRRRHGRTPKGEQNGRALLTAEEVKAIRCEFTGAHGQIASLSRRFGVSTTAMHNIVHGRHWSHV